MRLQQLLVRGAYPQNCFGKCRSRVHLLQSVKPYSEGAQNKTYLVTAPKILRLDAAENVVVQLFGYEQDTVFIVSLKSHPDKKKTFATESITLTAKNGYQGAATLRLFPTDLPKDVTMVYLEARSSDFTLGEKLPVSRNNGFLFIQTDKPLYTPEQSVKVRVYSLSMELKPALRPVTLTFLDPDAMKVQIVDLNDVSGVLSMQNPFKIPLKPKFGVWKIKATYTETFTTTATAEFEVKEYVLPSISVIIQPEASFISAATFESFKLKVIGRYVHGLPVANAQVFLKFGYLDRGTTIAIPESLKNDEIKNGEVEFTLNIKQVLEGGDGPHTLEELNGKTFYVAVTVVETTGGISQDAELTTVKFALSPYTLALIATPPFIKPGLPYAIRVQVKDPLGLPVKGVPVKGEASLTNEDGQSSPLKHNDEGRALTSQRDGTVLFIYHLPSDSKDATFQLKTADSELPQMSQAVLKYTAEAYKSPNQRYLYIDWASDYRELQVGDYANINIYFYHHSGIPIRNFSYQIISRGKIVKFETETRIGIANYQSINFHVTYDMVPSIRLLVYYIPTGENRAELVADSVWISVKGKCVSGLKTELSIDPKSYRPKYSLPLKVKAGQNSLVAFSSVDTAIYNLRVRSLDPMTRTLRHIEQSDEGCGGGGGKDNADVFRLAGLTFMTNANAKATLPEDERCSAILRPKRAIDIKGEMKKKILSYPMELIKCCAQGVKRLPTLETCATRATRLVASKDCQEAFRECCEFLIELQASTTSSVMILARVEMEMQLGFENPRVRSFFPESWLWEVHRVTDKSGVMSLQRYLPDSLTTWEIKAVEMSREGICVADPVNVEVTQLVSLDVPVPYSVVRGEQVELRGSVYNQLQSESWFCVTLAAPQEVCLFQARAAGDGASRSTPCTRHTLEKESVTMVKFTLMALEVGKHKINFTLHTPLGSEILVKTLHVVPEGIKKEIHVGGTLDPQGVYDVVLWDSPAGYDSVVIGLESHLTSPPSHNPGQRRRRLELQNSLPPNLVPKSNVDRLLTVHGELLGGVIAVLHDPMGLKQLLSLPRGSAEVELMGILPVYYVFHYLQKTSKWNVMGNDTIRARMALKEKLEDGITSLMAFRKKTEHSYSMWKDKEGSTWLTAQVVKTLGQVAEHAKVDRESLCNSIFWLKKRQNQDGSFREEASYIPTKIMGAGADVTDKTAFLTSFTIIGISSGIKVEECGLQEFKDMLDKAAQYLFANFQQLKSTYVRAIAAYALALVDPSSIPSRLLFESLRNEAIVKGNPAVIRFWQEKNANPEASKPNKVSAQSVETTVYVLLSALLHGHIPYAKPILTWLSQDQRYGGGFHSTQDTILTLQALTEFSLKVRYGELNMKIRASYRNDNELEEISLSEKHPVAKPIQVTEDDDVIIATGFSSGVSIATMKTVYYSTTYSNDNCNFDLTIEVYPQNNESSDPMLQSPRIVACAKYEPPANEVYTESSHTVMEIYLPTGVIPIQEDLALLQNSLESRISNYEIQGDRVILQFDSVPSEDFLCVGFRFQELFRTGMVSSSLFMVYEYHDPENQCSKFYYPYGKRRLLRLCEGEQCQCMAAECSSFKPPMDLSITADQRLKEACLDHIKYAFKVKIESSTEEGDFMSYTTKILDVYKKGTEDVKRGTEVMFVKKASCSDVDLLTGSQYLIMGSEVMQIELTRSYKYKYPLDSQAWVENWPDAQNCKDSQCADFMKILDEFELQFLLEGCEPV